MKNKIVKMVGILIFMSTQLISQYTIEGVVLEDTNGLPLIGVNIIVKNTTEGTVTDINGYFTLEVDSTDILVISYTGFQTEEILVEGKKKLIISLGEGALLGEVVIISGKRSRRRNRKSKSSNAPMSYGQMGSPIRPDTRYNTESYAEINENTFKEVSTSPLSTFSVDVDAASYSNVRRFINQGSLPPSDAVRIEEMINYFEYDYPQPDGDIPFSVNSELSKCPWKEDHLLLQIGLQGRKIPNESLPPSNIVFLLDVSGSMSSANKLPLLKSSFKLLLEQLDENDKVAMVVYAGSSGVVLESTSGDQKEKIRTALEGLESGGSTSGAEGLELAYEIATKNFIKNGNNRIILATDGDFNVGPSSDGEMKKMIKKNRDKGVAISVLGFGMGNYKDSKMETIADNGNGNYAYIDNLLEARKVLVKEFGGTFHTIAKDVKFQLEFNPHFVAKYRLVGYENRLLENEDFADDKKDAGDIGSGHSVTALYEIILADRKNISDKTLKYQTSILTDDALQSNDLVTLNLRYKPAKKNKSKLIEQVVKNVQTSGEKISDNFKFAASVAEFGMLLRDSEHKGTASWDSAIALAKAGKGTDPEGYRGEMIRLMETAKMND